MALDIYVMPLWRFKVGDFRTPIETNLAFRPKIITPDGIVERPAKISFFAKWKAKKQVRLIRKVVERMNQKRLIWNDDGEIVFNQQGRFFEALRAYARWLDCREVMPQFAIPEDGDYYKHPVLECGIERPTCPHLIEHDCYAGYYLPCDFELMAEVEPYQLYDTWSFSKSVGSSFRLIRELEFVQSELNVPEDYLFSYDDPLSPVKTAFLQLREAAELSCRSGLPIIFWG